MSPSHSYVQFLIEKKKTLDVTDSGSRTRTSGVIEEAYGGKPF